VPRKPEIIVAEVGDVLPTGSLERFVPRTAWATRVLREIHPVKARITKGGDDLRTLVGAPVADYPHLEVLEVLP